MALRDTTQEIIPYTIILLADKEVGTILIERVIMHGKSMIISKRVLSIKVVNITAVEAKITVTTKEISLIKRFLASILSCKFILKFIFKNTEGDLLLTKKWFNKGF
jgi:hypothetical protein